jgi:glycosyltransferase involved in cell wall biosynthesis
MRKIHEQTVSVIVPIYNVEKYLRQCIGSIVGQSHERLQIVLVDDGSTDGSGDICDEFAGLDSRVEVIHGKNAGVAAARNTGLDAARGDYIAFVDSDDYVHPDMVTALLEAVERDGSSFSMCGLEYEFEDGYNPSFMVMASLDLTGLHPAKEVFRAYCGHEPFATAVVWLKLYRRHIFDGLRFRTGCLFEDTFILPELYSRAETITILPQKYYHYRQRANSIIHGGIVSSSLYRDLFDSCRHKILAPKKLGYDDFSCRIDARLLEGVVETWDYLLTLADDDERREWTDEWRSRKEWFEGQTWEIINGETYLR